MNLTEPKGRGFESLQARDLKNSPLFELNVSPIPYRRNLEYQSILVIIIANDVRLGGDANCLNQLLSPSHKSAADGVTIIL